MMHQHPATSQFDDNTILPPAPSRDVYDDDTTRSDEQDGIDTGYESERTTKIRRMVSNMCLRYTSESIM
jgi:hypothetical protein